MADAAAVFEAIKPYAAEKGCTLSTLALNKRGADDAVAAGSHMLSFVVSASEEHNLRNSRRTIQESMAQFKEPGFPADRRCSHPVGSALRVRFSLWR